MHTVVLATKNIGKVKEFAYLLKNVDLKVVTAMGVSSIEETGLTFIENAMIKARHAARFTGLPAIADDSGLTVNALDGAPGIYSARYAGELASDQQNVDKLLTKMSSIKGDQRAACFHCLLVYLRNPDDPTPLICHGTWSGMIARYPSGSVGFGYDPIFLLPEKGCTAAELSYQEKLTVSHRGRALRLLLDNMIGLLISTPAQSIYTIPPEGQKYICYDFK